MAEYNVQMHYDNGNDYDNVYPVSKGENIYISEEVSSIVGIDIEQNPKPTVEDGLEGVVAKINDDIDFIETKVGEVRTFSSIRTDLTEYLLCDGSIIEITDYPELAPYLVGYYSVPSDSSLPTSSTAFATDGTTNMILYNNIVYITTDMKTIDKQVSLSHDWATALVYDGERFVILAGENNTSSRLDTLYLQKITTAGSVSTLTSYTVGRASSHQMCGGNGVCCISTYYYDTYDGSYTTKSVQVGILSGSTYTEIFDSVNGNGDAVYGIAYNEEEKTFYVPYYNDTNSGYYSILKVASPYTTYSYYYDSSNGGTSVSSLIYLKNSSYPCLSPSGSSIRYVRSSTSISTAKTVLGTYNYAVDDYLYSYKSSTQCFHIYDSDLNYTSRYFTTPSITPTGVVKCYINSQENLAVITSSGILLLISAQLPDGTEILGQYDYIKAMNSGG